MADQQLAALFASLLHCTTYPFVAMEWEMIYHNAGMKESWRRAKQPSSWHLFSGIVPEYIFERWLDPQLDAFFFEFMAPPKLLPAWTGRSLMGRVEENTMLNLQHRKDPAARLISAYIIERIREFSRRYGSLQGLSSFDCHTHTKKKLDTH